MRAATNKTADDEVSKTGDFPPNTTSYDDQQVGNLDALVAQKKSARSRPFVGRGEAKCDNGEAKLGTRYLGARTKKKQGYPIRPCLAPTSAAVPHWPPHISCFFAPISLPQDKSRRFTALGCDSAKA